MASGMELQCSFTLDVLKVKQNKYVLCMIRVAERATTYFFGQDEPYITNRWVQPEHWALFDGKLRELSAGNTLKYIKRPFWVKLMDSLFLKISKPNIPINLMCQIIKDIEIDPKDVVAFVECKIEWHDSGNCKKYVGDRETTKEHITPLKDTADRVTPNINENLSGDRTSNRATPNEKDDEFISRDRETPKRHANENLSGEKEKTTKNKTSPTLRSPYERSTRSSARKCRQEEIKNSPPNTLDGKNNKRGSPHRKKLSNVLETLPKEEVYQKNLAKSNAISTIDIQSSIDSDEIHSPSPKKDSLSLKTNNKRPAQNDNKKAELFSDSEENLHMHQKKKTRIKATEISSSSSSSEPQDENSLEKAVDTLLRNMPILERNNDSINKKKTSLRDRNVKSTTKVTFPISLKSVTLKPKPKKSTTTKNTKEKFRSSQENRTINKWLSKKKTSNENENEKEKTEDSQITTNSSRKEKNECDMDSLLMPWESVSKSPILPEIETLDLMSLESGEILNTFDEYQSKMEELFHEYKSKPKRKWNNGVNNFTIIDLLNDSVKVKMMFKLADRFETSKTTPTYNELFSMVLMPEWVLGIFMKKYHMTRQAAIEYIKAQKDQKSLKMSLDDSAML